MSIPIDEIIRTRRKTIALVVAADARLIVRSPLKTPEKYLRQLVEKKQQWILDKQSAVRARTALHPPQQFADGDVFLYLGKSYPLRIVSDGGGIRLSEHALLMPATYLAQPEKHISRWYKRAARTFFQQRTDALSQRFGLPYRSLKITNAKRRWGSCGSKNTLNFTWRLMMAPLPVIDYVIVHELVHTREKNHAAAFWNMVTAAIGDYKAAEKWLAEHQRLLELLPGTQT